MCASHYITCVGTSHEVEHQQSLCRWKMGLDPQNEIERGLLLSRGGHLTRSR